MRCEYCGSKFNPGQNYWYETKYRQSFCGMNHLRAWVKRHYGSQYFHAVTMRFTV